MVLIFDYFIDLGGGGSYFEVLGIQVVNFSSAYSKLACEDTKNYLKKFNIIEYRSIIVKLAKQDEIFLSTLNYLLFYTFLFYFS
jgi:hypothetical protein